jgi:hypothetical protein
MYGLLVGGWMDGWVGGWVWMDDRLAQVPTWAEVNQKPPKAWLIWGEKRALASIGPGPHNPQGFTITVQGAAPCPSTFLHFLL